jgi:hypothetical protein
MKERYRGFNLCGGAAPVLETLLGHVSQWSPNGSIDYVRRAGSIMRYEFSALPPGQLEMVASRSRHCRAPRRFL